MHYYQFDIGDYASRTRHLTVSEDCAYRRLLDEYYLSEKPLTGDIKNIARKIGMKDYETEVGNILQEFFTPSDDGWRNDRADREIITYKSFSEAGKRGAAKRWGKGGDSPPIATPYTPPIVNNNHKPITNKHIKRSEDKKFVPPTLNDVIAYCADRNKGVDPEKWFAHYTSNGWKVGRNGMKNWKAAIITWERNEVNDGKDKRDTRSKAKQHYDALREIAERSIAEEHARALGSGAVCETASEIRAQMDNSAPWDRKNSGG